MTTERVWDWWWPEGFWTGGDQNSINLSTHFKKIVSCSIVTRILDRWQPKFSRLIQPFFLVDRDQNWINLFTLFFLHYFSVVALRPRFSTSGHPNSINVPTCFFLFFFFVVALWVGFYTSGEQKSWSLEWWLKFSRPVYLLFFFFYYCCIVTMILD